ELISTDTPQRWIKWIGLIKKQYPANILVASIMGSTKADIWQRLAKRITDAGADALELNISCPHGMPERAMGSLIGQDPVLAGKVTAWVKKASSIPVIVKLTPNVTDIGLIARACVESGADALAGINTVRALAGINIDTFEPLPSVGGISAFGGYGGSGIKPIALRCVAEMVQAGKTAVSPVTPCRYDVALMRGKIPVSGGGGIFHWPDAVEFLLVGASTLQICTAVMLNGYGIIHHLKHGLKHYLVSKGFDSVNRIIGLAQRRIVKHSSLKSNCKYVAIDRNKCLIDCRRCLVVCRDAGFQAIAVKKNRCTVIRSRCDGCGLCVYVCPVRAIN
ncbi:MAG: NAD-dependent dihydropyrimidine dehydrogenase subunit PreA, partial [Planctomycetes bacterium]|nr:NAD-dependent dihydropyrimidine dehydrogenase subunit PreA [Planctomycetota bacterium]